jgi:hypothetical protein
MDAKTLNIEGFSREITYFADCVRANTPPERAGLDFALQVMRLYEAFLQPEGTEVSLPS